MKVLLLENVPKIGKAGDVVEVKPGYGRNYLVPKGLAQQLSRQALAEVEQFQKVAIRRAERELEHAREIASKLQGQIVRIYGKTGKRGEKLYGSITTQALATAMGEMTGKEIDKRKITIPEPIKSLGLHDYSIRLHHEVTVDGKVEVVKLETDQA